MKKAKQEILNEYSALVGLTMSGETKVEQYLICGVKIGEITAMKAAKIMYDDYKNICDSAFSKQ